VFERERETAQAVVLFSNILAEAYAITEVECTECRREWAEKGTKTAFCRGSANS
jgi:hypothetical protein